MRNILPSQPLKPYVHSFGIQEGLEELTYRIYPGTSVVMGFQYSGRLSIVSDDMVAPLSTSGITGLSDRFKDFKTSNNIGTILVFFSELGAVAFLPIPVHEIFGGSFSLKDIFGDHKIDRLEDQLAQYSNDLQRVAVIEAFLLSEIRNEREDFIIRQAIAVIKSSEGNIRMSDLSVQLNLSISQLEKRFRRVVGATPKKFASLVRFNNILEHRSASNTLTELAYRVGYFDQAHFNKDFKLFTGKTPEEYFALHTNST